MDEAKQYKPKRRPCRCRSNHGLVSIATAWNTAGGDNCEQLTLTRQNWLNNLGGSKSSSTTSLHPSAARVDRPRMECRFPEPDPLIRHPRVRKHFATHGWAWDSNLELNYLACSLMGYWLTDHLKSPEANAASSVICLGLAVQWAYSTHQSRLGERSSPSRRANLPEHNIAEDMRWTRFGSDDPTLLQLANERGVLIHSAEERFILLPTVLTDFGQRWAKGIPWIESYRSEAKIFYLYLDPDEESGPSRNPNFNTVMLPSGGHIP